MKKMVFCTGMLLIIIKLSSFAQSWFNTISTLDDVKTELKNHDYEDINVYNADGVTGVTFLAKWGDFDKLRLLVRYGADVNKVSFDVPLNVNSKNTALHYACIFGDNAQAEDIIHELVDHGADVNARNADGDTPITLIAVWLQDQQKRARVLQFLVEHGALINAQNYSGNSILHLAAAKNDGTWIYEIAGPYANKLDFNLKNKAGQTPIELALSLGFGDAAAVLGDIQRVSARKGGTPVIDHNKIAQ